MGLDGQPNEDSGYGGGVGACGTPPRITNCQIHRNTANARGGGLYIDETSGSTAPLIANCLITRNSISNSATGNIAFGAGLAMADFNGGIGPGINLVNTTIADNGDVNNAVLKGGGFYAQGSTGHFFRNAIIYDNAAPTANGAQGYLAPSTTVNPRRSCVEDGDPSIPPGNGVLRESQQTSIWSWASDTSNTTSTPNFVDSDGPDALGNTWQDNDYRLKRVSLSIDRGDNTMVTFDLDDLDDDGNTGEALPVDLLRKLRFIDDPLTVDAGMSGNGYNQIVDYGAHEMPTCPEANILSAVPASGTFDRRQPHMLNDCSVRQGIGYGSELITVTLSPAVTGAHDLACWSLCESGIEKSDESCLLTSNSIPSVVALGGGQYRLTLARPISGGHWTTIKYLGSTDGNFVTYRCLPGDVSGDGTTASADMISMTNCLNNIPPGCMSNLYGCDMDRSGGCGAPDIIRLVDLFNGASKFISWLGVSTPTTHLCPTTGGVPSACGGGQMAMSGGPESGEVLQFMDSVVSILAEAEPRDKIEEQELSDAMDALTQWSLDNLLDEERKTFAEMLTEPSVKFASELVKEMAADMAKGLQP